MSVPMASRSVHSLRVPISCPMSTASTSQRSFSSISRLSAPRQGTNKDKDKLEKDKARRRRKRFPNYMTHDLKDIQQFSLCDAMRYIKAFEVGRDPKVPKYDLAIRLKTTRDGPVVRNQIRLPHAVKTNLKIAVICPPDHKAAKLAQAAGATYVGEDVIFEKVKQGDIDFDRCIAHPASLPALNKAQLGRVLGPRGLMPSAKLGTVGDNVATLVKNMLGGSVYRERQGTIRMAIGQLAFTPEQLRDNVKAFVDKIKSEVVNVRGEDHVKEVHEIVLSSTNSPGFSLTGEFKSDHSPPSNILSAV